VGTRYEDQPVEQWAGPESLDPTPVWKQYVLVALLAIVSLVLVVIVAFAALAPELATPPALVPGDRLVLAASDLQSGNLAVRRYGPPLIDDSQSFWLVRANGTYYALLARWAPRVGDVACDVAPIGAPGFQASCAGVAYAFSAAGDAIQPTGGQRQSARGLDRYLVSVSGERLIVNLNRVIQAAERTGGPIPTGIPQPQATP
jgi:hypothetical protein